MAVALTESRKFWSAQSAWTSARRSAQAKAENLGVNLRLASKEAVWRIRGKRYMRGRRAPSGAWIVGDGTLADTIAQQIEAAPDEILRIYDQHMGPFAFRVWRGTPVASGLLRASWNLTYRVTGESRLTAQLVNRTPYIHFAVRTSDGFSLAEINAEGRRLARRIGEEVIDRLGVEVL